MVFTSPVWLARNKVIFQDITIPPHVYASKNLSILDHFPQSTGLCKQRRIIEETIDKIGCRSYFDGAT